MILLVLEILAFAKLVGVTRFLDVFRRVNTNIILVETMIIKRLWQTLLAAIRSQSVVVSLLLVTSRIILGVATSIVLLHEDLVVALILVSSGVGLVARRVDCVVLAGAVRLGSYPICWLSRIEDAAVIVYNVINLDNAIVFKPVFDAKVLYNPFGFVDDLVSVHDLLLQLCDLELFDLDLDVRL